MSKKTMLLALAVTAMFALPSAASAQEIHFKGVTTFGGFGFAGYFQAINEPKISCTNSHVNGSFDSGSTTTGKVNLTFTGCTAEFLGIKGSCNVLGDSSGVITSSAAFHLITTTSNPGILLTPVTTTVICIGFSRLEYTGNGVIGTITGPECGKSSKTLRVSFNQTGGTQEDKFYTLGTYDLSAHTEGSDGKTTGASGTAGLEVSLTFESFTTEGTLECT
jgi:uncharacterized protein with GYD domain